MTPIEIVGGLFGLFAVGLIVLLIYKSTLTMHEDDQLFLDEANSHMQEEQTDRIGRLSARLPGHVDLPETERSSVNRLRAEGLASTSPSAPLPLGTPSPRGGDSFFLRALSHPQFGPAT